MVGVIDMVERMDIVDTRCETIDMVYSTSILERIQMVDSINTYKVKYKGNR